jgi:hypothetical protein
MRSLFSIALTIALAFVFFTAAAVTQDAPAKKAAVADEKIADAK